MNTIKSQRVQALQTMIGYTFINPDLAWEALQCSGNIGFQEGSKRLALIGDVVLRLRVTLAWYPTNATRSMLNSDLQNSITNVQLTYRGRMIGLDALIVPNPSQLGTVQDSQIADSVEAIIGAVYLDAINQDQAVRNVMTVFGFP